MKKSLIKNILSLLIFAFTSCIYSLSQANIDYLELSPVDIGTFNEYRYQITDNFSTLKRQYDIDGFLNIQTLSNLLSITQRSYNYLPDNLQNKAYYNSLYSALERSIKDTKDLSNYNLIKQAVGDYLDRTEIQKMTGDIEAFPKTGNAPLITTLRGRVKDPYGSSINNYNYTWYIVKDGQNIVIGSSPSISYNFREEGNFSVFLNVKSSHRNEKGYTDVLPFKGRVDIEVKEKVGSLILKIGSYNIQDQSILKFTPEEALYGIIFDASSTTSTDGTKFIKTSWDFGNGIKREYSSGPKVERVSYLASGEYNVSLELTTNDLKKINRNFTIYINNPIATIKSSSEEGFLGDKFTFTANPTGIEKNLNYSWEIVDINNDSIVLKKTGSTISYSFLKTGKFNIKLSVVNASGQSDVESKIIQINSRPPVAKFTYTNLNKNKPNQFFLDGSKSYDPDSIDEGKLIYSWFIDGNKVPLEKSGSDLSSGYYTFDKVGDHIVSLKVEDPQKIVSEDKQKISVKSTLSIDFNIFPRVTQRDTNVEFIAKSPEAMVYEWDFGDGEKKGGNIIRIGHSYAKSGDYNVKLKVKDKDGNENEYTKYVYISESNTPKAFIDIGLSNDEYVEFVQNQCSTDGAYILNRANSFKFSGNESINTDGSNQGLDYSWKIGNDKLFTNSSFDYKFDELGCFPIKLSVSDNSSGKSDNKVVWVKVENKKPILSSIDIKVADINSDPIVVNVSAIGSKDPDGVIQSYLWYYYTDLNPEPQDFRSTISPNTTFVLPKIAGNYYFAVTMKDSNDERSVYGKDSSLKRYFISISGDNLNTPLLSLTSNNSSVSIGDEVVFNAKVENILGDSITNKVTYYWDFDGDGFYDKETTTPDTTYKYKFAGEFYAKVKVKNKGFSNVKTIQMNVANKLLADFSYISIGSKVIFLNNSSGDFDKAKWDLGNGDELVKKSSFTYKYSESKTYRVILTISKGTKTDSVEKDVTLNIKNILKANKSGLVLFTYPSLNSLNQIILDRKEDNAYVYLGESKGLIKYYSIDNDINIDSDLNGGSDDDSDNKKDTSYFSGDPYRIALNDSKSQKVRAYILDEKGEVIKTIDFEIVKNYIEESEVDLGAITFPGISVSEKDKIEKLKTLVGLFKKDSRIKSGEYLKRLQENWFDETEKTKIILEFEGYLNTTGEKSISEITDLLESLLVEGQDDKSGKNISYNALKTLVPKAIKCEKLPKEFKDCYSYAQDLLSKIKDSNDIEKNKANAKIILDMIVFDKTMSKKEAEDFKAILYQLVYGSIDNIPKDIKTPIINETKVEQTRGFLSIIGSIFYWIGIILLVIIGLIGLYYIYYKFTNKDSNIGFQDFIIDKTSGNGNSKTQEDVLGNVFSEQKPKVEEKKVEEPKIMKEELKMEETKVEPIKETPTITAKEDPNIPSWLKGSFDQPTKVEEKKVEEPKIMKEELKMEETKVEPIKETPTMIAKEDPNIPSWLKGSFDQSAKVEEKKVEEPKIMKEEVKVEETKVEPIKETPTMIAKEDPNIPSWLKGSFDQPAKVEEKKVEEPKIMKEELKMEETKVEPIKEDKVIPKKKKKKKPIKKAISEEKIEKKEEVDKSATNKEEIKKDEELWNDGMNVPDWLKPTNDNNK